ncbi:MAG: efflux RND transporter permease subunit [Campylobacterales bacterium]|nr:efflux RND transporter permease subunit [Campylobacterales bacterium]
MIRSFVTFSMDRPIINHIIFVFMMLLAIFAYQNIPKEIFPPSNMDKITITGAYVGASADVLDKMAVKSIEDNLKSISEIDTVETTIQNGYFYIESSIKPNSDNQLVLSEVKDIISNIKRDLPADMNEPVAKMLIHDFPLLLIAISGENADKRKLLQVAEEVKSELSSYKDLSSITIQGDADEEVLISIDDKKLEAYGLSKTLTYQAISQLSSIFPIGTIEQKGKHLYLSTINGEKSAKALQDTLITVGVKRVRIGDIASVEYRLSDPDTISHFNAKQNVSLDIKKTKEGNAIALSREIRKVMKEYDKRYPDLDIQIYTDTSIWIKNRLNLVSSNIMFGLILVFIALFLSVNSRIAIVVALGIPASFMMTLVAADMINYSLNMLTLLGALIALGMIVDEAIVVAENIHRHYESGKTPREAAIDGAVEMFPAVLTATLTTVFAFLPLLIMSGEMGMFMKVLPVMISILLISSLFEAFFFLPLHSKELYSFNAKDHHKEVTPFWDVNMRIYKTLLTYFLKHKRIALAAMVISIIIATMGIMKITKFQLFPEFDSTQIYLSGKVNINNKLEDTEKVVLRVEKELIKGLGKKEISSVTSITGFLMNADQSFETGGNLFHIFINLHEKAPENIFDKYINPYLSLEYDDEDMIRQKKAQMIAKELKEQMISQFTNLKDEQGNKLFEEINLYVPQTGVTGYDIELGFSHKDTAKVLAAMQKIKDKLASLDGVTDIGDNAKEGTQELKFRVNEYGQQLGFSEGYVTSVLKGIFLQSEYGKMFDSSGLIRVKIQDINKDSLDTLNSIKLSTPDGTSIVRLRDICDFYYKDSFVKIFKEDSERVRSVFARVDVNKIIATDVMKELQPILDQIEKSGVKVIIKGEEKENRRLKKEMSQAAMIALFLIFISLVWMFNSLLLPLLVISSIPLSIFGALVGAKIVGINLTMPGVMGLIGLAGVVVNDGLIMISFIRKSKNIYEVVEFGTQRLRPILLTSITTILGLFTLMFFASGQALIIQPMAVSLGFGIAWATILNLYYIPLLYSVVYRVKQE